VQFLLQVLSQLVALCSAAFFGEGRIGSLRFLRCEHNNLDSDSVISNDDASNMDVNGTYRADISVVDSQCSPLISTALSSLLSQKQWGVVASHIFFTLVTSLVSVHERKDTYGFIVYWLQAFLESSFPMLTTVQFHKRKDYNCNDNLSCASQENWLFVSSNNGNSFEDSGDNNNSNNNVHSNTCLAARHINKLFTTTYGNSLLNFSAVTSSESGLEWWLHEVQKLWWTTLFNTSNHDEYNSNGYEEHQPSSKQNIITAAMMVADWLLK
jgi:hypothetical protein